MKSVFEFVKTTIVGGVVIVVPVTVVVLVLMETMEFAGVIVDPIIELLPIDSIGGIEVATVLSILIVLSACFLVGLAARSKKAAALGRWIEQKALGRVPMYRLIRTATRSFSGMDADTRQMKPATLVLPDQSRALVIIIEELRNGHAVVFVPSAPMATAGSIRYVSTDRLQPVDASLMEVADIIMQWGFGAGRLFDPVVKTG